MAVRKAKDRKGEEDATSKAIWLAMKYHGFKKIKFANTPDQIAKATVKILDILNMKEFRGTDDKTKALRTAWVASNQGVVLKKINKCRNYASTQLMGAVNWWQDNNAGEIPTLDQLEALIQRNIDLDNDEHYDLMKWWWNLAVPKACANAKDWGPSHRNYMCLYNGAPANDPTALYVPPGTEAIAVAMIENLREVRDKVWKIRQLPEYKEKTLFTAKHNFDYKEDGKTLAYGKSILPAFAPNLSPLTPFFLRQSTRLTPRMASKSYSMGLNFWAGTPKVVVAR